MAMKRLIICSAILTVAFSLAAAQGVTPVTLVVHTEGKKNAPTISKSDVLVFDNGTEISSLLDVAPAISQDAAFAILVDASGSNRDKVEFIKKSTVDIFDAAMTSPHSRGLLFTFADAVEGGNAWLSHAELPSYSTAPLT